MNKYNKYQEKLKDYKDAEGWYSSWYSNRKKEDLQGKGYYKLVNLIFSAEYCGQAYAGASNYHKSPRELNEAICRVIRKDFSNIINKALIEMKDSCSQSLIECEEELKMHLDKIKEEKSLLTQPQ